MTWASYERAEEKFERYEQIPFDGFARGTASQGVRTVASSIGFAGHIHSGTTPLRCQILEGQARRHGRWQDDDLKYLRGRPDGER
jgi:hypothetical protein